MEPPSSTTRVCGSSTQPEPVPPLTKALKKTQAGHEQPHAVATNLTGPPTQFQAVPPLAGPKAAQHTTSSPSELQPIPHEQPHADAISKPKPVLLPEPPTSTHAMPSPPPRKKPPSPTPLEQPDAIATDLGAALDTASKASKPQPLPQSPKKPPPYTPHELAADPGPAPHSTSPLPEPPSSSSPPELEPLPQSWKKLPPPIPNQPSPPPGLWSKIMDGVGLDVLESGPSTELRDGTGNAPEVSPQVPDIAKASALAAEPAPTTPPLPPSPDQPDQLKTPATDPSSHTLAPVSPTDLGPSTGLGDGTGKSTIHIVVDHVKAEASAPSVPGSVPEQPATEVDEPGSLVQKSIIIDPSDPATPADETEADFGGDQDEVEPKTLDSWLLKLCASHPHIAKKTAQVMAHLAGRQDLVRRVENLHADQALLEVRAVEL